MKITATGLFIILSTAFIWSQEEVILEGNALISRAYQMETGRYLPAEEQLLAALEKSLCREPNDDIISLIAGEMQQLRLDIDTFGLGGGGAFECIDCDALSFGDASIVRDTADQQTDSLLYTSFAGVDAGFDTLNIRYCNADTCSETQEIIFLVKRAGRSFYPPAIILDQEEVTQTEAVNELPGTLKCSFFVNCPDEYEGRDQVAYFTDYSMPTNELIYRASRFAGVDSICVVLCDEFDVCDTTHLAFRLNVSSSVFPFYDDFYSKGPYPNNKRWLDREVFINNQLAIDPRSVGVATFDGIDYRGRAYDTGFGPSDRLTSTYIDVPVDATFPTLSFWTQRGGYAEKPEVKDSLVLQFKNQAGNWISVLNLKGISSSAPIVDDFQFYAVPLGPDFRYNRFQFRFLAHSDGTGYRDNWHVDYIRLDNNPLADSLFNDISFTKEPDFILNNYSSMPWRHFQPIADTELKSTIDIGIYNHFSTDQNVSPSSLMLEETNTGNDPLEEAPTLFNGIEINVEKGNALNKTYDLMGDPTGFPNVWGNYLPNMTDNTYDSQEEVNFEMTYSFQNNSQNSFNFVGLNDRVSRTTIFSNYFAYDDGTAELGLKINAGLQIAVAYSAAVEDTIKGVQLSFPFTGVDITDQEFRLRIWIGELDDTPEYSQVYKPSRPTSFFDTLHGFTSYELLDEFDEPTQLAIPAGTFYVGWQQKTTCLNSECIAIGYDRSRPQAMDFIYLDNGINWAPISGIHAGALMIRPFMAGGPDIVPTALNASPSKLGVRIFPNPSQGVVQIQTQPPLSTASEIQLFNSAGQLLFKQAFRPQLDVSSLPGGIYFLQVFDPETQLIARERLIVVK